MCLIIVRQGQMEKRSQVSYDDGIHTVDSNRDTFRQCVAIAANEGGDLSERIDLEVIWVHTVRRGSFDNFEIKVVSLCDGTNRGRAWVALFSVISQSLP